jgi:hypothetical protein
MLQRLKLIAGLLFFAISNQAQTHDWAPVGANWYYDYSNSWTIEGYALYEVEKDTTVLGKQAKKITVFKEYYSFPDETIYTSNETPIVTYKEDDVIYLLNKEGTNYDTLAVFGAAIGTSWRLSMQGCEEDVTGDPDYIWTSIQDTGTTYVGNCLSRWVLISYGQTMVTDTIYEIYGTVNFALNHPDYYCPIMDAPEIRNLRCYSDENCTYIRSIEPCNDVYLSLEELVSNSENDFFIVYPNPASDNFSIQLQGNQNFSALHYKLPDMTGKIIQQGDALQTISVSGLRAGVYFVSLEGDGKSLGVKKVVVR